MKTVILFVLTMLILFVLICTACIHQYGLHIPTIMPMQRATKMYVLDPNIVQKSINGTFYWINMNVATKRRKNMQKIFNTYNISNKRIEAIVGIDTIKNKEYATTLSHMKAIQTFYDTNESFGIICEDDLNMDNHKYWRESLDEVIHNAPPDWQILQLSLTTGMGTLNKFMTTKNTKYISWSLTHSSALCYVINRDGAKRILGTHHDTKSLAADEHIYGNTKTYTYKYPMFTYPEDGESFIHPSDLTLHASSKKNIESYLQRIF